MTRTQLAALLDEAEFDGAYVRGRIARLHSRPLGSVLEPKHKNDALRTAFYDGWHFEDAKFNAAA